MSTPRATHRRLAALEAEQAAALRRDALRLLRLVWAAHKRLSLSDRLALALDEELSSLEGQAAEGRRMALCEESGAVALEKALYARYGQAALDAAGNALWSEIEASIRHKLSADPEVPLSADEELLAESNGASELYALCTDAELDALRVTPRDEFWPAIRALGVKYGLLCE